MVYKNDLVESERRIRAIIFYRYSRNPYFLLLDRNSKEYPGWEFVKGDFDEKKDGTLECTLHREIFEETGLTNKDFIFEPVKFDLNLPRDFLTYVDGVRAVSYLIEVGYPPPKIRTSEEHITSKWFDTWETMLRIGNRSPERSGDSIIFPRVFFKAKEKGCL